MKAKVLQLNNDKILFWIISFCVGLLLSLYAYSANSLVFIVMEGNNSDKSISELNLRIGDLEFQYITLRNSINLELAYNLGFKEALKPTYITTKPVVQVGVLNTVQ